MSSDNRPTIRFVRIQDDDEMPYHQEMLFSVEDVGDSELIPLGFRYVLVTQSKGRDVAVVYRVYLTDSNGNSNETPNPVYRQSQLIDSGVVSALRRAFIVEGID